MGRNSGGSGPFWRDLVVIVVAALALTILLKAFVVAGVLHPLRFDGEHPAAG